MGHGKRRVVKLLLSLPFLLVVGVVGTYTLGGFVVAPWWIKRELPQYLKTQLDATGSIDEIAINPFKLTLDVRNFAVTESGGTQPAIAFDRLFIDVEAISLFKRAWTFADISLDQPRLNIESDAKGALNLAKLTPKDDPSKSQDSSALPRLLLQKLALKQGRVTFTDKAVSKPATATLEPVTFELQDLSTLPDHRGEYTLSARLPAGGTLGWRGTISLAPFTSTGQIELKAMKLATLWKFVQDKFRIDEPGGMAALSLQYNVRYADSKLAATTSHMAVNIGGITLRQTGKQDAALTADVVALTGGTFSLTEHKIQFAELALRNIVANTLIDAEGNTNWGQFVAPSAVVAEGAADSKPAPGAPGQATIDAVNISEVRLRAVDQDFVRPIAIDIARAGLRTSVKASVGAETAVALEKIAVDIENIRVSEVGAKGSLVTLAAANLSEGAFDLTQQKFTANTVKLSKAFTTVVRDAQGVINLAFAFARKPTKPSPPPLFTVEVSAVELIDGVVAIEDRGNQPALALDLQNIRVAARNVSSAAKSAVPFEMALQIKQGGTLRAQGNVTPDQQRATVKLVAQKVALAPLAATIEKYALLKLISGVAQASGQLEWARQQRWRTICR